MSTVIATLIFSLTILTGCGKTNSAVMSAEEAKSNVLMTIEDFDVTQQLYNLYVIQYMYSNKTEPLSLDEQGITDLQTAVVDEMKAEIVQYLLAQLTEGVEVTEQALATSEASAASMYSFLVKIFLPNTVLIMTVSKSCLTDRPIFQH